MNYRTCKILRLCTIIFGLMFANSTYSYEPDTHSKLSIEALNRSVLVFSSDKLSRYGLKSAIDASGSRFRNSKGSENQTIEALVGFGADWEDNRGFMQATRHFYNPVDGKKLLPGVGETSPDWALEDNGLKSGQDFSYRSMRLHFLRALNSPAKSERDAAWGLTFQTMGHVLHHLQDMAQPQHVRGDVHCDKAFCKAFSSAYSPSVYEYRIDTNPAEFGGYPAVFSEDDTETFNAPRKFWHTNPPGGQATGKGIAEFTNHGFISAGTNFDKPNRGCITWQWSNT